MCIRDRNNTAPGGLNDLASGGVRLIVLNFGSTDHFCGKALQIIAQGINLGKLTIRIIFRKHRNLVADITVGRSAECRIFRVLGTAVLRRIAAQQINIPCTGYFIAFSDIEINIAVSGSIDNFFITDTYTCLLYTSRCV